MRRYLSLLLLLMFSAQGAFCTDVLRETRAKAELGDVGAMNYLGYLLLSGEGGAERDAAEGVRWLTAAASRGDVKAASNIGWLYMEGEVVDRDYAKARRWLEVAAGGGLPVAMSLLGDLNRDGLGAPADTLMADSLYRRAFESGLADAGYKLYALREGELAALPAPEKVKAGRYFYLRGAPSEGVKLFYLASDEGDATADALLGDAYSRAVGVPYDHDLSLRYFTRAALGGNASAAFILGELLEFFPDALEGEELAPERRQAAYWLERAAEGGIVDAAAAEAALLGE